MVPDVPVNWASAGRGAAGCRWTRRDGKVTHLEIEDATLTVAVPCDPSKRKRLCLSQLAAFRTGASDAQRSRPPPLTRAEIERAVRALVSFTRERGDGPILVLLEDEPSFAAWCALLVELFGDDRGPSREVTTALAWAVSVTAPFLDRTPYGEALVSNVARALRKCAADAGLQYAHPHYCGHGLFFLEGEYRLAIVEDGWPVKTLASYRDETEFVRAASAWNDHLCSGAEPSDPVFAASSAWELANQRLTRARLTEFARENAEPEGAA